MWPVVEKKVEEENNKKEMKFMNIDNYGIDLLKIIIEAKENGNDKFATLIEKQIYNLQKTYDVIAEKYSSMGDKDLWNIDPEYLEGMLKK